MFVQFHWKLETQFKDRQFDCSIYFLETSTLVEGKNISVMKVHRAVIFTCYFWSYTAELFTMASSI